MSGSAEDRPDVTVRFLEALLDAQARIAGDIAEIRSSTWAIHGTIAVDGEVIMAEFNSREAAETILAELSAFDVGPSTP